MLEKKEEILKKIDTIALSFDGINKYNTCKHISYEFENQTLFYLKIEENKITIGCHKGYLLEDKFDFTISGKYMRHLYITNEKNFSEEIIKRYVKEAILCSLELNEKSKLKQSLKRK